MVKQNKLGVQPRGLISFLSPLEISILSCLWGKKGLKVRQIHGQMRRPAGVKRKIPVSSVAVTLDRLHKSKIVTRKMESGRGGIHYIYSARLSKADFEQQIVERTVNGLLDSFGQVAFAYFNGRFSKSKSKKPQNEAYSGGGLG